MKTSTLKYLIFLNKARKAGKMSQTKYEKEIRFVRKITKKK